MALDLFRDRFDLKLTSSPEKPAAEATWVAAYTENENEVLAAAATEIPSVYVLDGASLPLQDLKAEHQGGGVWHVTATWGKRDVSERETGSSSYSFDTTGGTRKMTQSLETISRNSSLVGGPPDFEGAIGVTADSVEGVDITVPQFSFTETHYVPAAIASTATYQATLFLLTGRINNAPFKGFARGECLFLGASGSKRGTEDWEISFKFAAQPNEFNLQYGDNVTVAEKLGWHYIWVRYEDSDDANAKRRIKVPTAAYVERVYNFGDFSLLGLGV
jgi:hypothetical protein